MVKKWINRGLAIVLLLLVIVFIGMKAIPVEQLDQLWAKDQIEFIERMIIGGMIGFGALLAVFVFDLPAGRRRTSDQRDAALQAQSRTKPKVELAIAPTITPPSEPPPIPPIPPSIKQTIEPLMTAAPNPPTPPAASNREEAEPFTVITGYAQHIGEREEQQDAFGFSPLAQPFGSKQNGVFAVLADGMGGYAMGKEAGELAVQTMLSEHMGTAASAYSIPQALEHSLHMANKAVYELALEHGLEWSVGTTLIAVDVREQQLHWISAGDSRIYLYRGGVLIPLTRDHVYANRLNESVKAGKLTQEEADSHPERHLLTSYLGIPRITEIDANQAPLQLMAGDFILLVSDGLYDDLSEPLLQEAVRHDPQQAAAFILEHVLAQQRPYQDNATIMVIACS
ncbi:PP2C family protein-serine/threonine phosphatase [Paenibacillus sp. FJAT-27812]|uniref:PP2C family protein-serine/threonine phosphatase n=1 Tax=Paenibacillus sp. FJAT-27812 TaxID=1684143 RepID=UPI0006A7C325|nr:protein phosphatase 2C domain-containing protein [Paenibacillus sp. FJAT-27812]